jgi:hypothetical protein
MIMLPLGRGLKVELCLRTTFENFLKVTIEQLCYLRMKNFKIPR